MELGEKDEEPSDEIGREKLVENGELSAAEEGFLEGAEEKGELGVCSTCGKPLGERGDVIEREVDGELKWYCKDVCADTRYISNKEKPEFLNIYYLNHMEVWLHHQLQIFY